MPLPASPHKMNTESSSTLLTELEQQADEFMALVKSTLLGKNQPQRYTKFLSLLEEPRLRNISHIMHLLDGHESLIMHFNWFVSPKFRVSPVDLKRKLYQRSARTTRSNESIIAAGESMEQHQHSQKTTSTLRQQHDALFDAWQTKSIIKLATMPHTTPTPTAAMVMMKTMHRLQLMEPPTITTTTTT